MVCIVEAILEWKDPLGVRGCGFFHVVNDRIVFQRGYWDKLTFLRIHGLPVPENGKDASREDRHDAGDASLLRLA